MITGFRPRWLFLTIAGVAALAALDLSWLATLHYRVPLPDFYVYYLAAQTGQAHGWAAMYDPSLFLPRVTMDVGRPLPYLNPPELAWIVLPLSWLPYAFASVIWAGFLVTALAITWRLAAPGIGLTKAVHGGAAVVLLPLFVSVFIGQVSLAIVTAAAVSWWLLRRGDRWLAGVALAVILLKPQAAFLVPLALLLAGYWRVVLAWLACTAPLLVIGLLAVGSAAVHDVARSMAVVQEIPGPVQISIERQLPFPLSVAGILLVIAVSIAAIVRSRGTGPSIPFAVGLVASAAVSPYINFYDLSAPLLAGWLILRTNPPSWHKAFTFAMYLPLFVAPLAPVLTLVALCTWLASLLAVPTMPSRSSAIDRLAA